MSNEETVEADVVETEEAISEEPEASIVISASDLAAISNAKVQSMLAKSRAEQAAAEAHVAALEYRSVIQQVFIRYGLKETDRIDDKTGVVTHAQEGQE